MHQRLFLLLLRWVQSEVSFHWRPPAWGSLVLPTPPSQKHAEAADSLAMGTVIAKVRRRHLQSSCTQLFEAISVIINEHTVEPVRIADQRPYPDDAVDFLSGKGFDVVPAAATEIAIELGNHRAANVVLLGALAEKLEIPSEIWEQTIDQRIPERFLSLNRAAFAAGREALQSSVGAA